MSFIPNPSRSSPSGARLSGSRLASAPVSSVPRGWVPLAAAALIAAALVGTGLGVSRSLGAKDVPTDTGDLTPVPNTTLAKALPADSLFDEGRIRAIAREEAQAALGRSAPKPKAAPKEDDASDAAAEAPDASTTTLALPKTASTTPRASSVSPATPSAGPTFPSRSAPVSNPYPPGLSPN